MFQTISFKSYMYMPLKSENVLILHCTARDAPNLFPPDINVLLISRVYYYRTQAEAKVVERVRKTSCKCITFAPAKIV